MANAKAPDTGERIKALFAQVEAGVKSVYESDNYRKYLSAMSKFHTYSFRNTLLILAQYPDATRVAGYNAWQDKFNRHVRKSEKGISILGYTPRSITTIREKKDDTGKVLTGPDGKAQTEKVERKVPAFTPVYVFDISQTEGDPLPQLVHNLEGEVDGFKKLMAALEHVSPLPIQFEEIEGGARGYCNPTAQRIAIRQGMSEAQTIKTAIHEITHAYLHGPGIDRDRHTEEVEAESMAFIVSDHYGIDTSDYSFLYLASWSSGRELAELAASLDTIQHKAFELIEGIDAQLRELTKEQELTQEQTAPVEQRPFKMADQEQQAVYRLGKSGYLYLQATNGGHDYSFYGPRFGLKDGGRLNDPTLTLQETRDSILAGAGQSAADVEQITQEAFEKGQDSALTAHAAAVGITREQYLAAGAVAPVGRTFAIYQLKHSDALRGLAWSGLSEFQAQNVTPSLDMYELVYSGPLTAGKTLEDIYEEFNINHPADFRGHSLTKSDVVAVEYQGKYTANFVDTFGFANVPTMAAELEGHKDTLCRGDVPQAHTSAKPKGIKAVMASAQARAEERAAARTEAKNQMLLSPDGRREM